MDKGFARGAASIGLCSALAHETRASLIRAAKVISIVVALLSVMWPGRAEAVEIFGCELVLDADKMIKCLQKELDKNVKNAKKKLEKDLDATRKSLDALTRTPLLGCKIDKDPATTAKCLERHVAKEVAMARVQLEREQKKLEAQLAAIQRDNPLNGIAESLQGTVDALAAMGQMNLEALGTCLKAAQATQGDIAQLTQRFVADPARFPEHLMGAIWSRAQTNIDIVLKEQLEALNDSRGRLPKVDTMLDGSLQAFAKIAKGDPSARCIHGFAEPFFPALRASARGVQKAIDQHVMAVLERDVLPAIMKPVAAALGDAMAPMLGGELGRLLPTQAELDRIVRAIAAEQLIRPAQVEAMAKRVVALSKALADPARSSKALAELQASMAPQEIWPEAVAVQVGMEIMRFSGHKWIDSDMPLSGAFFSTFAVSILASVKDGFGNVSESVCGLVPEAGAAVCSVYKQLLDVAYDQVTPQAAKMLIAGAMHSQFDQFINEVGNAYAKKGDVQKLRAKLGPFAALLDKFPAREAVIQLATQDKATRTMQKALFDYHDSVLMLARAAAQR